MWGIVRGEVGRGAMVRLGIERRGLLGEGRVANSRK